MLTAVITSLMVSLAPAQLVELNNIDSTNVQNDTSLIGENRNKVRIGENRNNVRIGENRNNVRIGENRRKTRL